MGSRRSASPSGSQIKTSSVAVLTSRHFTEVFVNHLAVALMIVPSHHAGGISDRAAAQVLTTRIGVSPRACASVLAGLEALGLVSVLSQAYGRSPRGDQVRKKIRASTDTEVMAIEIMRSGFMADQIRQLRQVLTSSDAGYECGRAAAQATAPQLLGVLARLSDVDVSGLVRIGPLAARELDSVWNEVPPADRGHWQDIEQQRRAIGDRAELYSVQLERSRAVGFIHRVRWVSRDTDSLGYDIEVEALETDKGSQLGARRHIEVKGSSGRSLQFFLSANELRAARRIGPQYEIHYWGEMVIGRHPQVEYEELRKSGYPVVIQDPATTLLSHPWVMEPSQYQVRRAASPAS